MQGSLEALRDALLRLGSEEVKLNIVDQGVGEITESDISHAENTKSVILGFHTKASASALKLAKLRGVTIDLYEGIYELIEDVTSALLTMMPVEIQMVTLGRAKIKAVFRSEKESMIVGGEVIEGKVVEKKKFKIFRDKVFIERGRSTSCSKIVSKPRKSAQVKSLVSRCSPKNQFSRAIFWKFSTNRSRSGRCLRDDSAPRQSKLSHPAGSLRFFSY